MVGVLAGLRPVGEGRVRRRVGQVERPALRRDLADQALAGLHAGAVDGLRVQALGGEQLSMSPARRM